MAAELSGPALHVAGRVFQAGDRVVLLANSDGHRDGHVDLDRHGPARLDNGMLATILAVGADGSLDIRLVNGRRLRVAADYVTAGHVDHGYATTVHKAQGLTCDQVFVVGPTGLYREAVYVAMSRARHGAFVFATNAQAAELVERPHTAGIPLEVEHVDELDHDLTRAIQQSRSKVLAHSHEPFIDVIADVAEREPLDFLWQRHIELRAAVHRLTSAGYTDPADTLARLERARTHRRYLAPGVRVNAADWDNLGTIITVDDDAGTAYVEFTSSDRKRTSRRQLDWADIRPVAHPEPVDITDRAAAHYKRTPTARRRTRRSLGRTATRRRPPPRRATHHPRRHRAAPPPPRPRPHRRRPRLAHLVVRDTTRRPGRSPGVGRRDRPRRRLARRPTPPRRHRRIRGTTRRPRTRCPLGTAPRPQPADPQLAAAALPHPAPAATPDRRHRRRPPPSHRT